MELQAAIDGLHGKTADIHVGLDTSAVSAAAAAAAVDDLTAGEYRLSAASQLQVDTSRLVAESQLAEAAAAATVTDAYAAQARNVALLIGTEEALALGSDTVAGRMAAAAAATDATNAAAVKATSGFGGWLGAILKTRQASISLYGGLLGTVGGFHLLADAAIETAAVVIPASIALASFGVAAAPTLQDIYHQMSNLYTVTQATGQTIYPLSGAFQAMAAKVQPEVYTLFGEALGVIGHNTGAFTTLAYGAGQVLDQLGARLEVAVTSGGAFHVFLANAVTDLAKLGDIVGNLGGVLGNVFRAVPGYAQTLLNLADAGSKVLEWASGVTEPLLQAGLALHGAWLYAGLGVTALSRMIPAALTGISGLAEKAAYAAGSVKVLGPAGEAAGAGFLGLATGAETAAGLPWGWITIAAAGIGVLTYALLSVKDATQQWADSLEKSVAAAPAVNGLITLLGAQAQVAARLSIAQATLAHTSATVTDVNLHTGIAMRQVNPAYVAAQRSVAELSGTQQILADQTKLYNYRVGVLGHALGGTSAAMGMLAASGIKMSEMLHYGKDTLAQIVAQVMATAAAYRAMGQTGGMLGADMNVMNVLASEQYNAVSKLNQAWGTWIGIITGGMASVSQFNTALGGMASDSAAASASLTGAFSSIKQNASGMTYTLKGFGPAAMQSWQQFTSAVNQGNTVLGQMRTYLALGAVSQNQFISATKGAVGELLPFTQGNKAALTMVDNLAVQAGYKGPAALKNLGQWAGVAGKAARDQLAKGMEAATIAAGQLSAVAKNLATTMNTDITAVMAQAQIKASGLGGSLDSLASALQHGGSLANGFHGSLVPVIGSMLHLHQSVPEITTELQAMGVHISQSGVAAIIAAGHLNSMNGNVHAVTQAVLNSISALQQYQSWLNSLHGKTIYVNTVFTANAVAQTNAAGVTTFHHRPTGHAAGTASAAAGLALVGEHGPELMAFRGGEQVFTASQTASILAMSRSPAVNPAMLATGGGYGGGEPGGHGGDIVVNVDGESLFRIMQTRGYRWQTRNAGVRTGLSVPGTQVGRA